MRSLVTLLASLLAMLSLAGVAGAACPSNSMVALDSTISATTAIGVLSKSANCEGYTGTSSGDCSYHLATGNASVSCSGTDFCSGNASLATHDVFTLVGPASFAPLTFTARLTVGASFTGHTGSAFDDASATLREGASNSQTFTTGLGGATSGTLNVSITCGVGAAFDLFIELDSNALGLPSGSNLTAQLDFLGLPAGYAVTSCQGYISDPSVPVHATSWGRLKTLYR